MATERRKAGPGHVVIEEFEDDLARVEWGRRALDLPRDWLPRDAKEGDHLSIDVDGDGLVKFSVDGAATEQARAENQTALDQLNAGDRGGDVNL